MMRKRFAFLAVLSLVLSILPWYALADDGFSGSDGGSFSNSDGGVVYTAYGDNDTYKVYVRADNKWQAAVYACGGDPTYLSSEVRSKLSDPDYGGDFYAYAQTFEVMDNPLEFPPWVLFSLPFFSNISDYMKSEVSNNLYTSALVDYKVILGGGSVGGGGTGGGGSGSPSVSLPPGDYYEIDTSDAGMYPYPAGYEVNKIYLSVDFMDVYLAQFANVTPARKFYVYVRTDRSGTHPGLDCVSSWALSGSPDWYVKYNDVWYMSAGVQWFLDDDNNWYYAFLDGQDVQYAGNGGSTGNNFLPVLGHYHFACDFSRDFPVVHIGEPDGDWPQNPVPVTPDPPEVPTPTAPTETVDPDPTAPTITWPTAPTLVLPTAPVVPTTPSGIDYTALLTLINDNLNSIDAYLQNFYTSFNSFRSDFLSGIDDIVDGLRNIYQYLGHLNNILEVHCKHITDQIEESVYNLELYLKRLFEWLPRQLDFDAQYDDSSVVSWLKQIYSKLGGGTYAPNPVVDPGGFFEWLGGIVAGFLASLLAGLPDKVQELVSDVTDLTDYFPFSAPWDLYALLLLFAHDPITPVFNIPWGMGGGHTVNVVVDCTQWDGVMAIVRSVEKIIFAGGLAKLTFDMFRPTDVMGD